ncbi:MAG TPA: RNA-binding S4 domain-containing protein [Bacteroidia bacterium]|nr:RNA-binding S4 domain-containing protein [Bacteroidia bacterium]
MENEDTEFGSLVFLFTARVLHFRRPSSKSPVVPIFTGTMAENLRIDKWLWSVRLFKTRSLATEACKGGRIKLNGDAAKPAKELKAGDEISFKSGPITRTVRVKDFPPSRIAAKFVASFYDDLTPEEEYERLRLMKEVGPSVFYTGKGRPTKRDRRKLGDLF